MQKELAPVELLVELLKEHSYDDSEEESAPGAHTVQDPSPDFELKLQTDGKHFVGQYNSLFTGT
jgi:hypothetical protein